MFKISIVTWNRRDILKKVLDTIERTCKEEHEILVSDNGSTDGTWEMLRNWQGKCNLKIYIMPENMGIAKARNAHWHECIGYDTVRMDDKIEFLCEGWLTALSVQSRKRKALVGLIYDETVQPFGFYGPILDFITHQGNTGGEGGPLLYIPAKITEELGAWDEIPGLLYGWEDLLYIHRARLIGWNYGFSLVVPHRSLAKASQRARDHAMQYHDKYAAIDRAYREGERDVHIPIEETEGYKLYEKIYL